MNEKSRALLKAVLELPQADQNLILQELLASLTPEEFDEIHLYSHERQQHREETKNDPKARRLFFPTREEEMEDLRVAIEEMKAGEGVPVEEMLSEMRQILEYAKTKHAQ